MSKIVNPTLLIFSAHNSAGPKMDMVLPEDGKQTGFLACNVLEYADATLKIIRMPLAEHIDDCSCKEMSFKVIGTKVL